MHSQDKALRQPLLGNDEAFSDNQESGLSAQSRVRSVGPWKYHIYICAAQLFLLAVSVTTLVSGILLQHASCPRRCEHDFRPAYSPALEAVERSSRLQTFDGSFAKSNVFRGQPNKVIDAAWDEITNANGGTISVPEEVLSRINVSSETAVRLPAAFGGGFMASVEALHQLHCLNLLRQATYEEYYRDKAEQYLDGPEALRLHTDHCIDILRQKLMCDADTNLLTYVWVKNHSTPFPNFNVQHKCRNFNALREWVVGRQLSRINGHGVERTPGAVELESPP